MQVTISLTEREAQAIERMASKLELSFAGVVRQAIRLYDAVDLGHAKVAYRDLGPSKLSPLMKDEPNAF